MTRHHETDALELGQRPAACLLAEQAPDDQTREHHITLVGGVALSRAWVRQLEIRP